MRARTRTTLLLPALAALALAAAPVPRADAADALPYSKHIPLLSPAAGATIEYTRVDDVVTFSFRTDVNAVLAEAARTGDPNASHCPTKVDFFVSCDGPGCKVYPANRLVLTNQEPVLVRFRTLLDLTDGDASPHRFLWGADVSYAAAPGGGSPCVSNVIAVTEARFTLRKKPLPSGPPNLSLSVAPDVPGIWPKTVTVTDAGGPSKATFLVVSVKTLALTDPVVARNCSSLDGSKTHTLEEMIGGGSKRTFDVPPLPPSKAQTDALLKALAPAAPPTPPPGKTPPKAAAAQTPAFHDPNVHQVVTCQYRLDAHLGADTNASDVNKTDNALSRTIRVDVPLN